MTTAVPLVATMSIEPLAPTVSYDVADACKEVFEHVGTNNGFTCHNTLILADGVTFNLWGC